MLIENRLKVSVWIAERVSRSTFRAYVLEEDHETDGPANQFAKDLGTYSVDPDFLDGKFSNRALRVEQLLKPLADAPTFAAAAAASASNKGIETANAVVALHHHEFRGRWSRKSPLTFLGSFDSFPIPGGRRAKTSPGKNYRYLELEGLRKFWAIELRGTKHVVRAGWIGLSGKETVREFPDEQKAQAEFEKAVRVKEKAGYVVRPAAAPPKRRGKRKANRNRNS
jgi:predicted DNA-binding WGR domain protein